MTEAIQYLHSQGIVGGACRFGRGGSLPFPAGRRPFASPSHLVPPSPQVHRDLKPENLLFRDRSEKSDILVTDFGLAKLVGPSAARAMDRIPSRSHTTLRTSAQRQRGPQDCLWHAQLRFVHAPLAQEWGGGGKEEEERDSPATRTERGNGAANPELRDLAHAVAPEILMQRGYGKMCDLWSIGKRRCSCPNRWWLPSP
jgi:serine/threonine protein kinase